MKKAEIKIVSNPDINNIKNIYKPSVEFDIDKWFLKMSEKIDMNYILSFDIIRDPYFSPVVETKAYRIIIKLLDRFKIPQKSIQYNIQSYWDLYIILYTKNKIKKNANN